MDTRTRTAKQRTDLPDNGNGTERRAEPALEAMEDVPAGHAADAAGEQRAQAAAEQVAGVVEIFPGATRQQHLVSDCRPGRSDLGMATAEYAIATLAAVGFAGLLVVILKSDEVRGFLLNIIRTALSF